MARKKTHIRKTNSSRTLCNRLISKAGLAVNDEVATCKICQQLKQDIKVGRPKKLTPLEMYKHFEDYKLFCKANPYKVIDFKGKDAEQVVYTKEKPFLWTDFKVYLFKNNILSNLDEYKANKDGAYKEFTSILSIIDAEIKTDQIAGSGAGVYNGAIMSKVAGLVDKSEVKTDVKQTITRVGFDDDAEPDDEEK